MARRQSRSEDGPQSPGMARRRAGVADRLGPEASGLDGSHRVVGGGAGARRLSVTSIVSGDSADEMEFLEELEKHSAKWFHDMRRKMAARDQIRC